MEQIVTPSDQVSHKRQKLSTLGTCCAYAGIVSGSISMLLLARPHWMWPFTIILIVLSILGSFSRSRSYIVDLYGAMLITVLLQAQLSTVFNLGQQSSLQNLLLPQQVTLINQRSELLERQAVLKKQLSLLLQYPNNDAHAHGLNSSIHATRDMITTNVQAIPLTDGMIDYNHALLLKNIQFLPSNSLIKENQDATQENAMWIQLLQDYRLKPYDAQIAVNNALLLPTKVVTPAFHTYPSTCDARPLCTIPSWQQDLQNGWRTVSQSWARTWHFWFWLIIALLGIFFLLPTRGRIYREISYRVFYNGTLSQFRGVLPSGMRELQKDLQMVEIGLWRSGSQQGRVQNGTIHFDLGPGTTVKDVFVSSAKPPTRWRLKKDLVEQADEEIKAFVDTATGAVVLQLVQWPVSTRSRFGDYFVRLYIVVDYFAGNIDAEAHIPDIERLLDIRGSLSLAALANGLRFLDMLLLSVGISFILLMCSYYFFNGTDLSELFERFALIGVVTFVVLESFVTMLLKSNLKQQKVVSTGL